MCRVLESTIVSSSWELRVHRRSILRNVTTRNARRLLTGNVSDYGFKTQKLLFVKLSYEMRSTSQMHGFLRECSVIERTEGT